MGHDLFHRYLEETDAFQGKESKSVELSKAHKFLQIVLIFANVIFLIFGCVLMGVGSYATNHPVASLAGSTLPVGIVVLGVFIMFLSFLGCLSAWKQSRFFLGLYFFFLMLLTFLLLVVGASVVANKSQASTYMIQGWSRLDDGGRNGLQDQFSCCGLKTWNDTYAGSVCPPGGPSQRACLPVFNDLFVANFNSAGTAGIVISFLMVLFLGFVCLLMRGIKAKKLKADLDQLHTGEDSAPAEAAPPTQQ